MVGNKPMNVIVPELLAAILKEQQKTNKILSEMVANTSNKNEKDTRSVFKKLGDLADDGIMNKSNKKTKKTKK